MPRPRSLTPYRPDLPRVLRGPASAVVVGGGIAGVTAALLLAERGVRVTLLERAPQLGGRLAAWPRPLAGGAEQMVEHGFHGFFRQYYNWRNVLRRIDPDLAFLRPLGRYPIASRRWPEEDFTGLPGMPPVNLLALIARSPSLRLRDLRAVDGPAALPLLSYERRETYERYDGVPAATFLDALRMPDRARAMLFDVFAHSFFNHEAEMSAAEMIMQFHFYFLRNPEGLDLDAPDRDYEAAIWTPLATRLRERGATIRTGVAVDRIRPGWTVVTADGDEYAADHVVLATDPAAARDIVGRSDGIGADFARRMAAVRTTAPYAVQRLWLDGDVAAGRATFTGVSGEATLDSVTLYHRLEREPAAWAARSGGGVVELHAYAAPAGVDAETLGDRMWTELRALWPEAAGLSILDSDARVGADAPAFDVGSDAVRPDVDAGPPGLLLAGDWVRMPFPCALMERAAASAMLAVNVVLERYGVRPVPVYSVPPRGVLSRRR